MKIEIVYNLNLKCYEWKLWDGSDGIDFYDGFELELGQCFEQIIVKRTLNALQYEE